MVVYRKVTGDFRSAWGRTCAPPSSRSSTPPPGAPPPPPLPRHPCRPIGQDRPRPRLSSYELVTNGIVTRSERWKTGEGSHVRSRSHALQELEQLTVGRKDPGGVRRDGGFVRIHRPGELVELHRFGALVVRPGVDLGGFGVRLATDPLDAPVRFGLDLVQIPFPVPDDAGSLTVAFRPEPLGDLPAFADHAIVDLRPHALVIVDSLEANIHEFDAEHLNFLRRRSEEFFLDLLAPFLDGHERTDDVVGVRERGVAQRQPVLGGAND